MNDQGRNSQAGFLGPDYVSFLVIVIFIGILLALYLGGMPVGLIIGVVALLVVGAVLLSLLDRLIGRDS